MTGTLVRHRLATAAAVATTIAGPLAAGCASPADDSGPAAIVVSEPGDEGPYAGLELDPPLALPGATLTADDGDRLQLRRDLSEPVRVFFFGYTHCPDICSLIMSDLALATARLPDELAADVQVVLVTSDPARDDPATFRAYLDRFDPDFTGLTGDLDTITSVAATMGVAIEDGRRLPSGGYEVAHGAQVVGFVGDRGVVVWTEGTSVEDFGDDLAQLAQTAGTGEEL